MRPVVARSGRGNVSAVHPIERLRSVARAEGEGPSLLVREAAVGLAGLGPDALAMVTACRRLVDRHPTVAPLWWLAARVMTSSEPRAECKRAAEEIAADTTAAVLTACLPDDATVVVLGWPEQVAQALRRRGDLEALVVDCVGEGRGLWRQVTGMGIDASLVPDIGVGAAVLEADLVALEATALGPDGFVAPCGSRAAAAVARHAGIPVWVAAGQGRVLPGRLWESLLARVDQAPEDPWECAEEVLPLDLADEVARPAGLQSPSDAAGGADCPVVPELLRPLE